MKIGILVEGSAELEALKLLTERIKIEGIQLLSPIQASMQPKSAPGQIARVAAAKLGILKTKKAERVIVLIDREDRPECSGGWAVEIEAAFKRLGHQHIKVVIKNRKFENWLIADVGVFRKLKARYKVTEKFEKSVVPDKADTVADAKALLDQIVIKHGFHKRRDAAQVAALQDHLEIGKNSRSFRRFLRLIGHPHYKDQSKKPFPKGKKNG